MSVVIPEMSLRLYAAVMRVDVFSSGEAIYFQGDARVYPTISPVSTKSLPSRDKAYLIPTTSFIAVGVSINVSSLTRVGESVSLSYICLKYAVLPRKFADISTELAPRLGVAVLPSSETMRLCNS